jgi:hypothetical protein
MIPATQRLIVLCIAALALAGCASDGGLQSGFGGGQARPKTILVSDFVLSSDVAIVDHGYTARLERKTGNFPTHERKPRTIERVNDEIVATIVATLREAGLDAQPGSEDALTLSDEALLIGGRLRPAERVKPNQVGFGGGRGSVVADMSMAYFSSRGKKQLMAFSADEKGAGKPAAAKQAAARNAAIAAVLAAQKSGAEKLSGDVEAQARRIGRAAGEKIVAYAKEQGWLAKAEGGEVSAAPPAEEKPTRMPPARPQKKPAKPDAQEKPQEPDDPDKN